VKGEQYLVLVSLMDGKPYECFAGTSDKIALPKRIKAGTLLKNGKKDGLSTYNLIVPYGDDDELVFKDVATLFDNQMYSTFTRVISLSLRHGVPLQFVCEQLSKSKDEDMQSFAKVVSRVLKQYIPDGTAPASEKTCLNCGSSYVAYQQGCVGCLSCSTTKCG
jgi:ribonucleoside-diphosphate reductase alpha chain